MLAATDAPPRLADVVAAHRLVKDLFTPRPWLYWRELLASGSIAWAALLTLILADEPCIAASP